MTAMQNPIQLTNIEEDFARLWEEHGKDKIRACLFNLIIYTQKMERAPFCRDMIHSVISKFPCRVILITSDDQTAQEYLRTSVSTETVGTEDSKVYCEVIQIDVSGPPIQRVPFIILPHIVADLPVYLLWTQDPSTENAVFPHLEKFARRIIFDAESSVNLQQFSRSLLDLMSSFQCDVGDLNWSALNGWRRIFASVFDTHEMVLTLAQSKLIRIHYNRNPSEFHQHNEIEAAYLQAWLAAQLNWKFQSIERNEGNIRLSYKRLMQDITLVLIPQEVNTLSAGVLLSIEIESQRNKAVIVFKRHPTTQQVFIQYEDYERCELPHFMLLGTAPCGQEIVEEIFYQQTGSHYRAMLQMLAQIPWKNEEGSS